MKAVKNACGVSVNDVVMAMCAGAIRRWLTDHDALPEQPLVAMIPVSVRDDAGKGAMGNRVSAMLARLPTNVEDPGERLSVAHEATMVAKSQQAAIPQGLVDSVSDFAPPALTARAARVVFATGILHRLPPFNLCISNVPGPNIPVYLGGARLRAHYPVSVITDGQGLNITVIGYLGQPALRPGVLPGAGARHRAARRLSRRRARGAGQGDRSLKAGGPGPAQRAGVMLAFRWKRLSGSYVALICCSRSYFGP